MFFIACPQLLKLNRSLHIPFSVPILGASYSFSETQIVRALPRHRHRGMSWSDGHSGSRPGRLKPHFLTGPVTSWTSDTFHGRGHLSFAVYGVLNLLRN